MKLRHTGLIDANFRPDLLHRRFTVIIKTNDLLLPRRQRGDRGAHLGAGFFAFEGGVGRLRLGRHQRLRQDRLINVIVVGQRRGRLDGVDANDRAAQPLLVGTHFGGQVRERRLASVLAP